MRVFLIFLISFFIITTGLGQDYVFEYITTSEGLSQNDVNDIHQDRNGFLWIGTNDGLNRFDGYNFKTYRLEPFEEEGVSSNLIFSIDEDTKGNLWLGTSDEGICRFDASTEEFLVFKNTEEKPDLLLSNQVGSLLAAKDGSIWMGSVYGIDIIRPKGDEFVFERITSKEFPTLRSSVVTDIAEDIYGRKWVGTKQGLYIFSEKDGERTVTVANSWGYVRDIFITDNEVFVGYTEGVVRLRFNWETLSLFKPTKICDVTPSKLLMNKVGDIFVGTGNGIYVCQRDYLNKNVFKDPVHYGEGLETNNLNKNAVTALFEDKSGIIWIGTNGGGLNKYNPKRKKFRHFKKTRIEGSLSYNKIRAIYEDRQNNIWIGTEGGGVNYLPKSEKKNFTSGFQYFDVNVAAEQNHAYAFVDLKDSLTPEILIGTGYTSVTKIAKAGEELSEVTDKGVLGNVLNSPFTLLKDRNGNVWMGTYGLTGLYKYYKDEQGEHVTNYLADGEKGSLVSNTIRSLMEDSYGNIWVGTDKGLNLLPPDQQDSDKPQFITFREERGNFNALSHNYILPMFQASDETIWIGTMGGGLNKVLYHPNPDSIKFKAVTVKDGLPNNVIKGILEDEYGFLWISSNKGLTRYDVADKFFVNYDASDGLQDNEFGELACYRLSDGEILWR